MANIPRLSVSIARQFGAGVYDCDPTSFVELDDDAAVVLAQCKDELSLDGIARLSLVAAESLAGYRGPALAIGLTFLSTAIASALARCESKLLCFPRLAVLSDEAAQGLSQYRGDLLLDGLRALSDNAAVALAGHVGDLGLSSVADISEYAADVLGRHRGEVFKGGWPKTASVAYEAVRAPLREVESFAHDPSTFNLAGLTAVTADQARVLAETHWYLNLAGVTAVSDEVAAILAQHVGSLYLGNLVVASQSAVEMLLRHKGPLFVNEKKLPATAAAMLLTAQDARRDEVR